MSKITEAEFKDGIEQFLSLVRTQPSFFIPRHPNTVDGAKIAEMAASFAQRMRELKEAATK